MKYILLLCLVASCTLAISQSAPYIIDQKQVGSKIEFYGQNTSANTLELTLSLKDFNKKYLKGYKAPVAKTLQPKQKVLFLTIEITGPTSYSYETRSVVKSSGNRPVANRSGNPSPSVDDIGATIAALKKEKIVLFDKAGCPRCSMAAAFFEDNGIEYTRMDISNNGTENMIMWNLLRESGYKSNNLRTPAIMVDGEISHSHKNLNKFLKSIVD